MYYQDIQQNIKLKSVKLGGSIMKLTTIEKYLKFIIIGFAICGLLVYAWILPNVGQSLAHSYPEFAHWYYPWLIFLWITVIPCYLVLISAWKVAANIGIDRSLSQELYAFKLSCLFFKHADKLSADNLSLLLRICNTFKLS